MAAKGNLNDLHIITHENGAQPGICESPFYELMTDPGASDAQRLNDLLDFFFTNHLDSYCAATVYLFYDAAKTQAAGEVTTWPGELVGTLGTPTQPATTSRVLQISSDLIGSSAAVAITFDSIASTPTTPQPAAPGSLTLRSFNAVQIGMTLEQVQSLLGPGTLSAQSQNSEIYTWTEGTQGANANVQFQNGKVVNKAQSGLY